jgi:succinate dehydrogenase / fumarate reductase, flavoprotein subunit
MEPPWLQRVAISGKSDRRQGRRNRRNPPMEVAPTAHYSMGGVRAHACDGRRGPLRRRRVRSRRPRREPPRRQLARGVPRVRRIVGAEAARASAELDVQVRDRTRSTRRGRRSTPCSPSAATSSRDRSSALRDLMSERCGVVRSEEGLRDGLRALDEIRERTSALGVRPDIAGYADLAHAFDLHASLLAARGVTPGLGGFPRSPRRRSWSRGRVPLKLRVVSCWRRITTHQST